VLLSSHVVSDLERVCDHVVVLVDSQVRIAGDVDELLATHHRLSGPRREPATLPADQQVVWASHTDVQSTYVVRTEQPILDPAWSTTALGLEDLVLAYMEGAASSPPARNELEVVR
jgi:ABC-2 type transport system ATP-binding protein